MKQNLSFVGNGNFRMKIALSLITAKSITIKNIRHKSANPGLDAAEVALLKLVDEVSNGTISRINDTGISLNIY